MAALPSSGGSRRLVLYGGVEELRQVLKTSVSEADDVSVLDPDGLVWYRQKATYLTSPPALRASSSMATTTTGVYMFGGILLESGDVTNDLWLLSGTAADTTTARMLPCTKNFANWILLHGIFMTFGWGGFLTWGALIARYFNGTGKLWFKFHVSFQVIGLVLATIGTVFAVVSVQSHHFMFAHGIIGIVVMLLGLLQPFNAFFRGKRPEEGQSRTLRRKIWEIIHHFSGRIAVLLALINISLGVFLAVVQTTLWALWYTYFAGILVLVLITEIFRWFTKEGRLPPQVRPSDHTSPEANYEVPESTGKTDFINPGYDSKISVKEE